MRAAGPYVRPWCAVRRLLAGARRAGRRGGSRGARGNRGGVVDRCAVRVRGRPVGRQGRAPRGEPTAGRCAGGRGRRRPGGPGAEVPGCGGTGENRPVREGPRAGDPLPGAGGPGGAGGGVPQAGAGPWRDRAGEGREVRPGRRGAATGPRGRGCVAPCGGCGSVPGCAARTAADGRPRGAGRPCGERRPGGHGVCNCLHNRASCLVTCRNVPVHGGSPRLRVDFDRSRVALQGDGHGPRAFGAHDAHVSARRCCVARCTSVMIRIDFPAVAGPGRMIHCRRFM